MNKRCIVLLALMCCISLYSQSYETESYSFSQIKNYHTSNAWSLVIEKSNAFLERYPFSPYETDILFYTAESYFFLDNLTKSKNLFEGILLSEKTDENIIKMTQYRLGILLSMQGEHEKALSYLHTLVENPFEDDKDKEVLLYSAQSLSALRRFDELTIVIEYYIKQYGITVIPPELEGLLGGLWLGMGVEAFEGMRFTEALEYFKRADLQKVGGEESPIHFEKSGLYQAAIHYILNNYDSAVSILEERLQFESITAFDYTAFLALMYGEQGDFRESETYAKKAFDIFESSPETYTNFELLEKSLYWYAVSLYENNAYTEASRILDSLDEITHAYFNTKTLDNEVLLLYAQSLYKAGNTDKSLALFEKYFPTSEERVKALFLSSQWRLGVDVASKTENTYLQGLSHYYLRDWDAAQKSFSAVLQQTSIEKEDWLEYYLGLSFYYGGDYSESLKVVADFIESNPYHAKIWDAYLVCSICALEMGMTERAIDYSLSAVQSAKTSEQNYIASVFAAELYMDEKRYSEANKVLIKFSNSNDAQSIDARMLLAQTYAEMGNIQQADNELKKIITQFSSNPLAREASYKRGELYFENGDYAEAEKLFKEFRFSYTSGVYTDFALYFEAESRVMQDDVNGAILLFTDLVNRYLNSSYRFASLSQLVLLHRSLDEYGIALEQALVARDEYPRDFAASRLISQINELTVLASGTDDRIAELQFSWERASKNETPEGRAIGYELASLYVQNIDEKDTGFSLLRDLDRILQNTGEHALHSSVLDSLAKFEREQGNCADSASYYLKEAEVLAMMAHTEEQSAKALYGAIEAFDCAGMIADANAVYSEMVKKYENTIWFTRAQTILNIQN